MTLPTNVARDLLYAVVVSVWRRRSSPLLHMNNASSNESDVRSSRTNDPLVRRSSARTLTSRWRTNFSIRTPAARPKKDAVDPRPKNEIFSLIYPPSRVHSGLQSRRRLVLPLSGSFVVSVVTSPASYFWPFSPSKNAWTRPGICAHQMRAKAVSFSFVHLYPSQPKDGGRNKKKIQGYSPTLATFQPRRKERKAPLFAHTRTFGLLIALVSPPKKVLNNAYPGFCW